MYAILFAGGEKYDSSEFADFAENASVHAGTGGGTGWCFTAGGGEMGGGGFT